MRTRSGKSPNPMGVGYNVFRDPAGGKPSGPVPALSLNFFGALPGAVTFSRASNATMFDSQGRLVWAPANLNTHSETFASGWTLDAGATITTVTGDVPAGFSSATELTVTSGSVGAFGAPGVNRNLVTGGVYVFSCWARTVSGVNLKFTAGANSVIVPLTASWQRVSGTITSTNTVPGVYVSAAGTLQLTGLQIEPAGADSPKAYTATAGSAYYGPRFDYDPASLTIRGLLIEGARTNLQPISQGATTDWTANFGTISTTGALIHENPAFTFTVTSTGSAQFTYLTTNPGVLTASTVYTSSVRVKRGNHPRVQFTVTNNCFLPTAADAFLNYNFDTDTLTVGGSSLPAPTGSRYVCADGSVILTLTYTSGTAPTAGAAGIISLVDSDAAVRLAGTGTNGATVHVLGVQLEQASFASSYIPTYGAAATRNSDTCYTDNISWYNSLGGTFVCSAISLVGSATSARTFYNMSNGNSVTERLQLRHNIVNTVGSIITAGGVVQSGTPATPGVIAFGTIKTAFQVTASNQQLSVNGGTVYTGSAITMPAPTRLNLGVTVSGGEPLNGWLRSLSYYTKSDFTNSQLQGLST